MASNDTWATFPQTEETKDDREDDWGDFGGFETAQPVTDLQETSTPGLISWAALSSSLETQPSIVGGTTQQEVNTTIPVPVSTSPELGQGIQGGPASSPPSIAHTQETPVQVESIEESLCTAPEYQEYAARKLDTEPQLLDTSRNSDGSTTLHNNKGETGESLSERIPAQDQEKAQKAETIIGNLEEKLTIAEQEKIQFHKNLEDLMRKHQDLEDKSKTTQAALEEQKQKFSRLQEDHRNQLQELRKAGHDALAIIVEEYKELSKQAVLEQHEKSQAELHVFLETEHNQFKDSLIQEQERFERTLVDERAKNDERVKTLLQDEQGKHKLVMESLLVKEREESIVALEMAVKEARELEKEAIKAAVVKEKDNHSQVIENVKKMMQEEREKFKMSIQEAINNERQHSKLAIQEALTERNKSREAFRQSTAETRTTIEEYLERRKEADSKAQQKQLLVMDLFLESTRTQLKHLMEGQQTS